MASAVLVALACCAFTPQHLVAHDQLGARLTNHELARPKPSLALPSTVLQASNDAPSSFASTSTLRSQWEGALTLALVAVWYLASVVANQTAKSLLSSGLVTSPLLTLSQQTVAALLGAACIFGLNLAPFDGIGSAAQLLDMVGLAAVFSLGFTTLNACFVKMHVSLVMVLRSLEPLTTLALSTAISPQSERVAFRKAAALLPVVFGCALSAVGPHAPSMSAVLAVSVCNLCFSLRGVLGKRIRRLHGTRPCSLFLQLCLVSVPLQLIALLATSLLTGAPLPPLPPRAALTTLLLSGASFWLYVQLSWVVLARMSAVSHSVLNSLRRPVTIAAALLVAPAPLSPLNAAGIALACGAALVYGLL